MGEIMSMEQLFEVFKAAHAGQDDTLDDLRKLLLEYYDEHDAKLWLNSHQPQLDNDLPIYLITEGRADEVLKVMQRLDDCVYI